MGLSDTAERRASWLSVFPQLVGSRLITGARCHMTWLPDYVGGLRQSLLQHGYFADPRQEFLGLGAANLAALLAVAIR
jgi:hypothetical protein